MITIEENKSLIYPKIDTLFNRNQDFSLNMEEFREPIFDKINLWEVTEKIDGTNIRLIWSNQELHIEGRTEKADVPKDLINWIKENVSIETLKALFGDKKVVLYGEGYGGKIQAGQNYSDQSKFILFDVKVEKYWLKRKDIEAIASNLNIESVPLLGFMDITSIVNMVKEGFYSRIGENKLSEGIIAKPIVPLFDNMGKRIIFKLKHKDFKKKC